MRYYYFDDQRYPQAVETSIKELRKTFIRDGYTKSGDVYKFPENDEPYPIGVLRRKKGNYVTYTVYESGYKYEVSKDGSLGRRVY